MSAPVELAKLIDHSLLQPQQTDAEMEAGCRLAAELGVASVCIKPYAVAQAVRWLEGSGVAVGTVIGFPQGSNTIAVKAFEAEQACRDGAQELDMVVNIGKVLQQDWDHVRADIDAVLQVARRHGALLKVIFETDFITDTALKQRLCQICDELRVDYVKTSTGFGYVKQPEGNFNYRGATEEDVQLMRSCCGPHVGVKASGGVRSREAALRMQQLGCTRLGTSASEAILQGESPAGGSEGY